jgi:hypothetical protein
VSSKSASLRPSSLYFQRRVPRSTSNPDLPSPSLSPEDELALAANGGHISTSLFYLPHLFFLYFQLQVHHPANQSVKHLKALLKTLLIQVKLHNNERYAKKTFSKFFDFYFIVKYPTCK